MQVIFILTFYGIENECMKDGNKQLVLVFTLSFLQYSNTPQPVRASGL